MKLRFTCDTYNTTQKMGFNLKCKLEWDLVPLYSTNSVLTIASGCNMKSWWIPKYIPENMAHANSVVGSRQSIPGQGIMVI
jgi:hypothetical protein